MADTIEFLLKIAKDFTDPDKLIQAAIKIRIRRADLDKFRERAKILHGSLLLDQSKR